jgi:aspartate aminotransferase
VKITPELKDSLTLKFNNLASEKNKLGEKIISLGLGEPAFETPRRIVDATYDAILKGHTRYSNSFGMYELRELISAKLWSENKIKVSPDNIIVTPGAKQAMLLALMALLEPGDEVINISPCYVSYVPQIKIAESNSIIHNVDLKKDDFSLDFDEIEKLSGRNVKVMIINFPHNPTGRMLTKEETEKLVDLIKKNNWYVISDEIYEKLNFGGDYYYSLGSFNEIADRVITVNGFSKTYSMTGWRIGYLAANDQIIKIVSKLQQHINTNTCTFVQKGACAAFSLGEEHIDAYNQELQNKASFLVDTLALNNKLRINPPSGGLFGFLNVSKTGLSSDDFAHSLLLNMNVAVTPGVGFGKNWDDHVRISLAANIEDFKDGIKLIDKFVNEL